MFYFRKIFFIIFSYFQKLEKTKHFHDLKYSFSANFYDTISDQGALLLNMKEQLSLIPCLIHAHLSNHLLSTGHSSSTVSGSKGNCLNWERVDRD